VGGNFANLGLKYNNENNDVHSKNTTQSAWIGGIGLERRSIIWFE